MVQELGAPPAPPEDPNSSGGQKRMLGPLKQCLMTQVLSLLVFQSFSFTVRL